MPISANEFKKKGKSPHRKKVQDRILRILAANSDQAFSSKELTELTGARRESVNQSLRGLEEKKFIERGLIREKDTKRDVMYAKITPGGKKVAEAIERMVSTSEEKE